ncbi:MAG: OmpA family protein [Bacteroidota bacterium]
MANLLNTLKDQMKDDIFAQASQFLGTDAASIKSAMGVAVPTILGSLIKQTSSSEAAETILETITKRNFDERTFDNLERTLTQENLSNELLKSGNEVLTNLMNNKLDAVVGIVASISALKKKTATSVMNMTAPLVLAAVGHYAKQKSLDTEGLSELLTQQSANVASALPEGMGNLIGFATGVGIGDRIEALAASAKNTVDASSKGSSNILTRILPLLLVLAVGYFGWQWWEKNHAEDKVIGETETEFYRTIDTIAATDDTSKHVATAVENKINEAADTLSEEAKHLVDTTKKIVREALDTTAESSKAILSNINFTAGSVGEKFEDWLSSGAAGTKNFRFNHLTFAKGSENISDTTEVNNLAAVLKAYPNVHIEVGGHTDSGGNADANMTLSQKRAEAIKAQLIAQGVSKDRVAAKGFGSSVPTTDNAEDAANRRVEIRVTQK